MLNFVTTFLPLILTPGLVSLTTINLLSMNCSESQLQPLESFLQSLNTTPPLLLVLCLLMFLNVTILPLYLWRNPFSHWRLVCLGSLLSPLILILYNLFLRLNPTLYNQIQKEASDALHSVEETENAPLLSDQEECVHEPSSTNMDDDPLSLVVERAYSIATRIVFGSPEHPVAAIEKLALHRFKRSLAVGNTAVLLFFIFLISLNYRC